MTTTKVTAKIDARLHSRVMKKLRGQYTALMTNISECIDQMIRDNDTNDLFLFINKRGPVTFKPVTKRKKRNE